MVTKNTQSTGTDVGVTGAQIRGARGLLNLSVTELAELARVGVNTVRRAEATNGIAGLTAANMAALVTALEKEGVNFISTDTLGPGVRLRPTSPLPLRPRRRDASK